MRCSACPYYKWVRFYLPQPYGYSSEEELPKKTDEFYLSREALGEKCANCSRVAARLEGFYDKDLCSGRFYRQLSLDTSPDFLAGVALLKIAPRYKDLLRPDTSTGCTALPPEVEDVLRKAIATVVQFVDFADAAVLAFVLRREPISKIRKTLKLERVEAVRAVRRVLVALEKAKSVIKKSGSAEESWKAAEELVKQVVTHLRAKDAPILLGLLCGLRPCEVAKLAGLNSRQAAYGRYRLMLTRLPLAAKLREPKTKAAW